MMRRYMEFVKPYRKQIVITLIIGIIKFIIPLLIPILIKYVIDDVIANDLLTKDEKLTRLFLSIGIMGFIFVVIRPPVEYYRQYFAQWTSNKILYDIRKFLYGHLQKLGLQFYANKKTGEVISRVINDVEQTKEFVITGLMNVWIDLTTIFIALGIMLALDIKLTLVSIIMIPFYAISIKYFFGNLRKLTRNRSQALAEVQGYLHERVQGVAVIKSFAIEEHEQTLFNKTNRNFLQKALAHTSWNAKAFAVVNTITDISPILIVAYAGYEVINGNLSIGTMVAFTGYIERLYGPLRRLVNSSTTLTQAVASMDRVFALIDEEYDITDKPNAKEIQKAHGHIEFRDVSFSYGEDESLALKNISLNITAGQTIALVGMSGGGKSTLVSLIPRFYDVTSGKILLDGSDIRDVKAHSLRNQIGMVLQDNILFSDTVKENILLGKPGASDEEVIEAAKAANAYDFIMNLPNGFDTKVGERGVKLSGGQKQRVAIARVFLKNPPILILDEATSALDLESEHLIQEALDKLARDRTTLIVAHRLSTITHADQIVLVEHGKIVEVGRHEELMAKKGHYYELFDVQNLN
ncbi:ABC transporter ATP-binding protein/permease [Caldibacillus lycopersici]|uniref:ABC transporter ATP-binding protein/permease n=1 Tax=Perspicuibacillus lycopersici TaxID=1325689 RepID=A0AAE3IUG5_9BACI|nr:ABC transporter ATP-binding protein/permease [Perspicuibacillus lycopersici]